MREKQERNILWSILQHRLKLNGRPSEKPSPCQYFWNYCQPRWLPNYPAYLERSADDLRFPLLSCNCSLQLLNCKVWSLTCSTTAGTGTLPLQRSGRGWWSKDGLPPLPNRCRVQRSFPLKQHSSPAPKTRQGHCSCWPCELQLQKSLSTWCWRVALQTPKPALHGQISSHTYAFLIPIFFPFPEKSGQWGAAWVD